MEAPTLLFIDPVCPKAYDPSNIDTLLGIGGTEQTMVTLAEGLAKLGVFKVVVEQHNRAKGEVYERSARYTHQGETESAKWIVVLRDPGTLLSARERFRNSKIYLYSHDLAGHNLGDAFQRGFFSDSRCVTNICVSEWHKTQTIETLKPWGYTGQFRNRVIYNPLAEDVVLTKEPYDNNKLIWLASPHKGLTRAYEIFKCLVNLNPDFRFYVTNPGYLPNELTNDKVIESAVINLGTLPHSKAMEHLRNSLCLFYPNMVFPETFGKILAEANAAGVPVLTHPIGAAREVLDSHPEQLVDCRDTETVVKRVLRWQEGSRPVVRSRPEFKLKNVLKEWVKLLNELR